MDLLSAQPLPQNAIVRTRKALVLLDVQASSSPSWGERATAIKPGFPNRCDELISRFCEPALVLFVCSTFDTGREVFSEDGPMTTENGIQSQQWAVQRHVGIIEDKDDSGLELTEFKDVMRANLINELYLCAGDSNSFVVDTATIAAAQGIKITIVEDCVGRLEEGQHDEVIHRLSEDPGAQILPC
ncbi:hypothetical protein LTR17_027675 [Elasticomyces elasticus]|nr:hypothetical protein LTR17_027675 [Elasticomyces elasticus]